MNKIYAIIIFVIIVVALGYLSIYKQSPIGDNGPVACTMEALVCPDGSAVGRSGPQCEFSACPNQDFFTGRLTQQGGDFFLATAAPEDSVQEVTYSLPLKFSRVSNALADLIGQEVRVTGKFSTGTTLEVETIDKLSPEVATTGEVAVGETKFINGVRITLNEVVEDSRCPAGVYCIQAGRLVANVSLKSDTDQETVNLASDAGAHGFDSFKISIVGAPLGAPGAEPANKVTFKVEEL